MMIIYGRRKRQIYKACKNIRCLNLVVIHCIYYSVSKYLTKKIWIYHVLLNLSCVKGKLHSLLSAYSSSVSWIFVKNRSWISWFVLPCRSNTAAVKFYCDFFSSVLRLKSFWIRRPCWSLLSKWMALKVSFCCKLDNV